MFIYQLVVKVEFGHFLCETFPGIFLFVWHLHANRGIDRIWLDVEFSLSLAKWVSLLPWNMKFLHGLCQRMIFSSRLGWKQETLCFRPLVPPASTSWGISEVPDLLTGDSECLAGDGESCTLMLGWSWYVDWFSLSIREQWFSISRIKTAVECWMLHVALGIGPCSIEAHWKFCDSQECSAIDRTGTWGTRRRAHCCSMESVWW